MRTKLSGLGFHGAARWLGLLALVGFLYQLPSESANACPAYLYGSDVPKALRQSALNRQDLRLFSWLASIGKWNEVPLDLVPFDEFGLMEFFPNNDWLRQPLAGGDRLIVMPPQGETQGGQQAPRPIRSPCNGPMIEIHFKNAPERYLYLSSCRDRAPLRVASPVTFDDKKFLIHGSEYDYFFQEKNHMLFREIKIGEGKESTQLAAQMAQMSIHSDIRNFFTLDLDGDDMESYLEKSRSGVVSMVGRVQFYLKLLFFKLKLSLSTDATFFRDSAHIPQMLTLPSRAEGRLHPGSGIVYSWTLPTEVVIESFAMPRVAPNLAKEGIEKVKDLARGFCKSGVCTFGLIARAKLNRLAMTFRIPAHLIDRGFFPQFIGDMKKFTEQADWGDADSMGNTGIYFETSALPVGTHAYDFWLELGEKRPECPEPVALNVLPPP